MPEAHRATLLGESPRYYLRINITKNTKGYNYETTVSVESSEWTLTESEVRELLIEADAIARFETQRRATLDEGAQ